MAYNIPLMLPTGSDPAQDHTRWFSAIGCVVHYPDHCEVFVGGTLIGSFTPKQRGVRNLLMVGLAQNPRIRKGRLAKAFEVSSEILRRVLRKVEAEGLQAVPTDGPGGHRLAPKVTPALRRRLDKMFAAGTNAHAAYRKVRRRQRISYPTVWKVYKDWAAQQEQSAAPDSAEQAGARSTTQQSLFDRVESPGPGRPREVPRSPGSAEEQEGGTERIVAVQARGGQLVQHVGAWLMLSLAEQHGLHEVVTNLWGGRRGANALRIAVDAVVMALSIGERCVEGVRRLATPSAPRLLRADQAPSASWVRRVLKRFAGEAGAAELHLALAGWYLREAAAAAEQVAVFYVDNHHRPYTGKHKVRRGWRMQDRRSREGTTDYYVHDEYGDPVFRIPVPAHDSLTRWLKPIVQLLRLGLGEEQRILVAFDRAGAYPQQLADLRDDDFEFVTYERRPYRRLNSGAFTETVTYGKEQIDVHERRANLGSGRGRVRRIALRMADGEQLNLLAVSAEPTERLIEIMLGRWCQENNFKHGNERWGINQLDGRRVAAYDPETIIPNPARRRLDRALSLARAQEGAALCKLERLAKNDPKRAEVEQEVAAARAKQEELESLRPHAPTHAPLEDTELAGRLVHHIQNYKQVVDTIRIVCINAESDLAYTLAPYLRRPREAKKTLANLFKAPGKVTVRRKGIYVRPEPAGTRAELAAFAEFYKEVNRWGLTLPGDAGRRPLIFRPPNA